MKLYTSYFYQIRNFPRNLIPLSTVVWPPKYPIKDSTGQLALIIDCPPFKPGKACEGLCNGKCNPKHPDDCKFLEVYREQLDNINLEQFLTSLKNLANKIKTEEHFDSVDFALIVFESPKNDCSERVAIQAWGASVGLDIKEWKMNE